MSRPIRGQGGHLGFPISMKNTSLLVDVEIHYHKPCSDVHSTHLPMASFEKFFSYLIIYSKKAACLNYPIPVHSSQLRSREIKLKPKCADWLTV